MLLILKFSTIFLYIFTIYMCCVKCHNVKNINAYRKLTIEDDKVCSPITKRKIELKANDYQSLFLTQSTTKYHNARWPIHWDCKFQVDASSYGGLFAVIQSINFRKNETTGDCIDFVQFRGRNGQTSKKICGDLPRGDIAEYGNKLSEFEEHTTFDGKIDTQIFISRDKLQPGETMDLEIVYTAFKRCAPNTLQYSCFYDSPGFCINETFFNDSIVNCPFEMDCRDEGSCLSFINGDDDDDGDDDSSMYSNIVLSAVTSLFFTFIFVIIVTWLCRKMGPACCLSCIGDQNNRTTPRPQSLVIEMQSRVDPEDTITTVPPPSAPNCDKDLPPSYESLFPQPQR